LAADDPLFRNADHALRFAYGRRSPLLDSVRFLTDMMVSRGRTSALGALSPEERVAQAAMLLAFVARMPGPEQACIVARYTRDERRKNAQDYLTEHVRRAVTGVSHIRMLAELVKRHYGKRVHLGMLASRFDVHRNTVMGKRQTIELELQRIEARADSQVILYLQISGLLE
jgi:hypothetical protein